MLHALAMAMRRGLHQTGLILGLGAAALIAACQQEKAITDERSSSSDVSTTPLSYEPAPAELYSPRAVQPHAVSRHDAYLEKPHVGAFAWSDAQWDERCRGVRTSYNPDHDLREDELTLVPSDPRWLDFVFWTLGNKVNEHQVEAYGGTGWNGPKGGIIFHWALGSRWERDTLHSFGFFIGHVVGEHRWTDTMFPDFFEKYGGVYGVNVKDRLAEIDPKGMAAWVDFLAYQAGPSSPYSRYLLHIDSSVDVNRRVVALTAGQGIAFEYSFERLDDELAMILTDCKAVEFFEMYDRFGAGFAAEGNWAKQPMPASALSRVGYADHARFTPGRGLGGATAWPPPTAPEGRPVIPPDLSDADRMKQGEKIYSAQCIDCHGASGDGAGFLAEGFDVKPRDFRQGKYEFRSTLSGELPTMTDVERTIRDGVPGTTMPAWGQFLSERDIGDVARYLVVFSPRFVDAWRSRAQPRSLAVTRPPQELADIAAHPSGDLHPCLRVAGSAYAASLPCRGEQLWTLHQCRWCHGDDARGDGPTARDMTDEWQHAIRPANLTYKWLFKNGDRPEDVYRSIFGGLNGTPMHSYVREMPEEADRWAIVAYVLSMSPASRPVLHLADFARERARRIGPDGLVLASP